MEIEKSYTNKILEDVTAKQIEKMKNAKNKRVTARLTDSQFDCLIRSCSERGIKVSRFAEEALIIALNGLAV